ncbi:MAG: Carbohydrate-selective porin OprB [Bacteroidetes bacterium]|nr:Carbohydrate-selective porin OprB [Bacteroidota bacterium]
MRLINKSVFAAVLISIFSITGLSAQEADTVKNSSPFTFEASYIGDLVSNFSGGIKTGTTYLGLANIKTGFDTEKANWWKGGEFFINVGNTHGGEPSANLVGDFQGVSNIEAGNLTFMYELWYRQTLGKFDITVGLQDLNANFAVSEYGGLFTNSSFGIHSSIADNISSPIFPLTALGTILQYKISDTFNWQAAFFDGTPDDFETNPYNIQWKLGKDQGLLAVTEFQVGKSLIQDREAVYKLGAYYHKHSKKRWFLLCWRPADNR